MASFLRKVAPAAVLAGAACGLVVMFDPALGIAGTNAAAPAPSKSQSANTNGASSATPKPTPSNSSSSSSSSSNSSSSKPTPSPSSSSASATCSNPTEVSGSTINTRFGPVQVSAMVDGTTVCKVYATDWPQNDGRSVQINAYAVPILDQQATDQGINFDGVSGATYTTEGYRQSLQSILDNL